MRQELETLLSEIIRRSDHSDACHEAIVSRLDFSDYIDTSSAPAFTRNIVRFYFDIAYATQSSSASASLLQQHYQKFLEECNDLLLKGVEVVTQMDRDHSDHYISQLPSSSMWKPRDEPFTPNRIYDLYTEKLTSGGALPILRKIEQIHFTNSKHHFIKYVVFDYLEKTQYRQYSTFTQDVHDYGERFHSALPGFLTANNDSQLMLRFREVLITHYQIVEKLRGMGA